MRQSKGAPLATRIQQLGGNLQHIAFDEPVAANALQYIAQTGTVFPNVMVGAIQRAWRELCRLVVDSNSQDNQNWQEDRS
jgi:hypothetical protein